MKEKPDLTLGERTDPTDKLLTVAEVAERCQCSEKTVKGWLNDGRLAFVPLGPAKKNFSLIRIRESALIKFWKQSERKAI